MSRAHRKDDGFTVIELGVTMLLMMIALVILLSFLINTTSVTAKADADEQAERDAQFALRIMTQDIRAANPILFPACGAGYGNCLSFDVKRPTGANPDCVSRVTYELRSGTVVQDRADSNCASNQTWTNRPIITVANASVSPAVPLFSYTDRLNRVISLTQACSADPAAAPCVPQARTANIALRVTYKGKVGPPLSFQASAALRNNR